jgi:hypothetical protein
MSQHELDQRPGCTQQGDCEISFRHHTELRKLELHLLRDPDRDGTSSRQLIRETGENFFQRPKAPSQQSVGVAILRSARPRGESPGQTVTFQNFNLFKAVCERPGDREAADACANHDRAPSQ